MWYIERVDQFVKEQCVVHPRVFTTKESLYQFFELWNLGGQPINDALFFKALNRILNGKIKESRPRIDGERPRCLEGVCLK